MKRKFDAKLFDNPPRPGKGSVLLFDTKTTGLAMRVPAKGTPALQIVARDPAGIERRVTFASVVPHGAITPDGRKLDLEGIRTAAVAARDLVRRGAMLATPTTLAAIGGTTLREAMELHVSGRLASGKLQGRAAEEYRQHVARYFSDWAGRPLALITRAEVNDRHREIGEAHGRYAANAAFRTFRAAYRRAERLDPSLPKCPVIAIDWFEETRRDPGLREGDLPLIISRIRALPNPIRRDFYEFVLFTGMRRGAAASVNVEEVNFKRGVLFVPNPKGGAKKQFELPLADHVVELLERRVVENKGIAGADNVFVFPAHSACGHITEPKERALGFSPHALRHVFTTVAGAAGVPLYQIKLLTNHSLPKFDVTLGYMWPSADQLRPCVEAVAARILRAGATPELGLTKRGDTHQIDTSPST
ncbi:MAG: hypothetical protein DCF16_10135 [Alphaproteobacteria bacterium]|nr:MAG: hypothetical protein DCF16_10135 [Alphaproteobacteria bacterium]